MGVVSLDDILVTPLKRIPTIGGDVIHALKSSEDGYKGFCEVYFSWIEHGAVKAWKCHQKMTLNLVVPLGLISFVFHTNYQNKQFRTENIGEERYARLTVPPGIWFGFQGKAYGKSLLMNVANIEHDPDEILRKPASNFSYKWGPE